MYLDLIGHVLIPLRDRFGNVRAYAVIDEQDRALAQERWFLSSGAQGKRYPSRHDGPVKTMALHRQIMGLSYGDPRVVDHINGNRLDNRRCNLRIATTGQNGQNRMGSTKGNSSRYRGVCWYSRDRRWVASVTIARTKHIVGYFTDELEAAEAARAFRLEHMTHNTQDRL